MPRTRQHSGRRTDARDGYEADSASQERARRRSLLGRFWRTARLIWCDASAASRAWPLALGLLTIIVLLIGSAYAMNAWNRAMFDGLQNRNVDAVARLSGIYFVILLVSVALSVMQVYLRMALQRRWRAWLDAQLVDRWLTRGRYYQLNLLRGDHANPEYRIADDVRVATESPIDFVSGITQALLLAATFILVLRTIGGALEVDLIGWRLHITGFLVIAAVLYALLASGAMALIGRRFVTVSSIRTRRRPSIGM
jgi:putative ATP-binding cassette transporter